ncbi:MAG: hypothetical protein ACJAWO_000058 [Halieaceae bacterium]|jgi:hypothetical protein
MNHYVGLRDVSKHMMEFDIFPPLIMAMVILGVLFGLWGSYKAYWGWFVYGVF